MSTSKTEGIILHTLDFKEYDQILTVFSPENGIQKFIFKGGQSAKKRKGSSSAPLTRGEFIYHIRNSDLFPCSEISVLSHYQGIRKNLETLETACEMIKVVHQTQQPGKPAPQLYTLFTTYLETLSSAPHPHALASSFLLKLLRHDGHLGPLNLCSTCQHPLTTLFLNEGESFCQKHASTNSVFFDEHELLLLQILLYSRTLSEISNLTLSGTTHQKIKEIYNIIISF